MAASAVSTAADHRCGRTNSIPTLWTSSNLAQAKETAATQETFIEKPTAPSNETIISGNPTTFWAEFNLDIQG